MLARIATQMFAVLIVLFVLGTGHSAALSGVVLLVGQVPGMLISPIAGALLERGRRVTLMSIDYVVAGASMAAISVLSVTHVLTTAMLLVIVALSSFSQPLSRVGGRSLFPILVPRALWDRSNAIDSGTFVIASVFGPGMAGLAVALVGARWSLMIPALFSVVAALALGWVRVPRSGEVFSASLLADARAGISYVFGNRVLRMLAGTMTVYNMGTGALAVAIPVLVLHRLHGGSKSVGVFFAVMGFAGFLAGIVMGRLGTERRERVVLGSGCALAGAALLGLAYASDAVVAAVLVALCGIANGPLIVAMFSLRQRATEPRWFGRAFAVSMNVNFSGYPIGSAVAGALCSHSSALAFVVAAALCAAGGLWPVLLPASYYEPVGLESAAPIAAE